MKIPKIKFSLPKIALPRIAMPSMPKIAMPRLPLPKFGKKKPTVERHEPLLDVTNPPETDEPENDGPLGIDDGDIEAKSTRKGFPKLQGKARLIVPAVAVLTLLAGGGGYYVWRMKGAPPQEAAAKDSAAAKTEAKTGDAASESGKPEAAKPEAAPQSGGDAGASKPEGSTPREAGATGAPQEKPAAGSQGEAKSEQASAEGQEGKPSAEGHEEGGHGKEKVVIIPLPPPPPPSEIEKMVRHLQDLQERVSAGDGAAFAEMAKHLRALGRTIFDAPAEAWEKKENTHALIVYLLSGGNPNAGRKALAAPKFYAGDAPIGKAAIAYLENVEGADRDFMLSLDPFALDPNLGGPVAFVQSILTTSRDREAAVEKLDIARLLSPGGLVEEAALRREIGLLAEANKYDRFASLARQYWARYRASPYADNFLRQFMLGVARVSLSIKLEEWEQLDDFIESLTPDTKRNLYLTVAQNASVVGNVALAAKAAQRARDLSAENSQERQRAILYGAAATVGKAEAPQSVHLLDGVDRAQLPVGDQPIYDAVAFVSGRIFHAPAKGFKEPPPKDAKAAAANPADADLAHAEQVLLQGDAVIDSVRKTMERTNP